MRAIAGLVLVVAVAVGGWLWARDSPLAAVEEVQVSGATTSDEGRIRTALESAARDMTTLHVRRDALEDAVAAYPSVAGLRVRADFPDRLDIEVLEHRPVAALDVDGRRVPVSGAGIVLTGVAADDDLPAIRVAAVPGSGRVEAERARAALAVAAAAPQALLERSERLRWGPKGLAVDLRDGPPLIFGDATDARAKWAGAARVLAEPSAAGATYLDLRVRGRVAAGGVGPVPQETPEPAPQPEL